MGSAELKDPATLKSALYHIDKYNSSTVGSAKLTDLRPSDSKISLIQHGEREREREIRGRERERERERKRKR